MSRWPPEPAWHENVLGIGTGVHIVDDRGYGRLTIARIDGKEIETWSFESCTRLRRP